MRRLHFLEYDPAFTDNPAAPYAVLPVPYERTVSYGRGTARAPAAILKASTHLEPFDEELLEPLNLRVQTLPPVDCRPGRHVFASLKRIAGGIMRQKRFLMTLGGEHSLTAPLVAAARDVYGRISVLQIDAHLDLRDIYQGRRDSHACVMRRIRELNVPVVHVGIRSLCAEEYQLVNDRRASIFWARALVDAPNTAWMDAAIARLGRRVYVTIDADGLDPACMPGTGTPEPGGLSWRQVTVFLRRLCAARTVVAADLVEVAPIAGTLVSEYTAARLAAKLMLYRDRSEAGGKND